MKVGDIVYNVSSVRTNRAVWRENQEISPGHLGVVLDVRPDSLNNPPLMDYVDVMLSVDGKAVRLGNHGAPSFRVVA